MIDLLKSLVNFITALVICLAMILITFTITDYLKEKEITKQMQMDLSELTGSKAVDLNYNDEKR